MSKDKIENLKKIVFFSRIENLTNDWMELNTCSVDLDRLVRVQQCVWQSMVDGPKVELHELQAMHMLDKQLDRLLDSLDKLERSVMQSPK